MLSLLKLEISGVVVQGIHQNSEKWLLSVRILLVKMILSLFWPLSVVMAMVPTLLRQLRRSLRIKYFIANPLPSITVKKGKRMFIRTPPEQLKKTAEVAQKKSNN